MPEIILLAVGSMFWPTLLAVVLIALRTENPIRILFWFYLGGMISTIGVSAAIVFVLEGSSAVHHSSQNRMPSAPWIYVVLGVLALGLGLLLLRHQEELGRRRTERKAGKPPSKTSARLEQAVTGGRALAFVAGVLLSAFPGPLAWIALADIAQLKYSTPGTLGVLVVFYVIMFAFLEVPILGYLLRPESTANRVSAFNAWLSAHMLSIAAWVLIAVGAVEITRGIVNGL